MDHFFNEYGSKIYSAMVGFNIIFSAICYPFMEPLTEVFLIDMILNIAMLLFVGVFLSMIAVVITVGVSFALLKLGEFVLEFWENRSTNSFGLWFGFIVLAIMLYAGLGLLSYYLQLPIRVDLFFSKL